jgi:hypothetical protein
MIVFPMMRRAHASIPGGRGRRQEQTTRARFERLRQHWHVSLQFGALE